VFDVATAAGSNCVLTAGKDGLVKIWLLASSMEGDGMTLLKKVNIATAGPLLGAPRSVAFNKSLTKIIVGTYGNSLVEVDVKGCSAALEGGVVSSVDVTGVTVVVKGHAADVKCIATHPTLPIYASVGSDKSILLWSSETNSLLSSVKMREVVYSIAFHPDGEKVAIGLLNGDIVVKKLPKEGAYADADEWEDVVLKKTGNKEKKDGGGGAWSARPKRGGNDKESAGGGGDDDEGAGRKKSVERKDIKHSVTKLMYSPDGNTLIAACRDYFLYVFDVANGYKKIAVMKGHSTFVTHMDFSEDSKILQSNDAAREILYWDVMIGKQIANSYDLRDTEWATWSCVYGWSVQGIWDKNDGEQNILSVARSNDKGVVATGDDHNMINLFRYPALQNSHNKAFGGHMCPVVSLVWRNDDKKLFSTGGLDNCIFQWDYE
jgi:WD40 repeat protein